MADPISGESELDRWLREDRESGRRQERFARQAAWLRANGFAQTQEARALAYAADRLPKASR